MIYLDNAATTEMLPEIKAAARMANDAYGNAHTLNEEGMLAAEKIEKARDSIAFEIGAEAHEVYFTSGATEGNNWCIRGVLDAWWKTRWPLSRHYVEWKEGTALPHIVTDMAEHHSVLNAVKEMEERGLCEATYVPVDEITGEVSTRDIENAIKESTVLVSVMMVNNETGVLNPVWEIGDILKGRNILFHVDATQALGKMKLDVKDIGCHMLTGSGHKFHAGKGRGIAYISQYAEVANLMEGGAQQMGRRPGTEDVTAAVCLAEALIMERAYCEWGGIWKKTEEIKHQLTYIPDSRLNGDPVMDSGIVSVGFKGVDSEMLLTMLERNGVICSAGSACTTGTAETSHVLQAMHVPEEYIHGTIRISVGARNTMDEITEAMKILKTCVEDLRKM